MYVSFSSTVTACIAALLPKARPRWVYPSQKGSPLLSVEWLKGGKRPERHPRGMPEGSRGLRSAARDDTSGCVRRCSRIPEGCQTYHAECKLWHPAGVQLLLIPEPEVSRRSTSGYLLASLRDVGMDLLCLATNPLETVRNLRKQHRSRSEHHAGRMRWVAANLTFNARNNVAQSASWTTKSHLRTPNPRPQKPRLNNHGPNARNQGSDPRSWKAAGGNQVLSPERFYKGFVRSDLRGGN